MAPFASIHVDFSTSLAVCVFLVLSLDAYVPHTALQESAHRLYRSYDNCQDVHEN